MFYFAIKYLIKNECVFILDIDTKRNSIQK